MWISMRKEATFIIIIWTHIYSAYSTEPIVISTFVSLKTYQRISVKPIRHHTPTMSLCHHLCQSHTFSLLKSEHGFPCVCTERDYTSVYTPIWRSRVHWEICFRTFMGPRLRVEPGPHICIGYIEFYLPLYGIILQMISTYLSQSHPLWKEIHVPCNLLIILMMSDYLSFFKKNT